MHDYLNAHLFDVSKNNSYFNYCSVSNITNLIRFRNKMDSIFISSIVQSLKDSAIERPHDIAMVRFSYFIFVYKFSKIQYDETAKVRNISNRCLYVQVCSISCQTVHQYRLIQVEKTSSFLRAHSFRSGDRAAIMMINAIELVLRDSQQSSSLNLQIPHPPSGYLVVWRNHRRIEHAAQFWLV